MGEIPKGATMDSVGIDKIKTAGKRSAWLRIGFVVITLIFHFETPREGAGEGSSAVKAAGLLRISRLVRGVSLPRRSLCICLCTVKEKEKAQSARVFVV